MYRFFEVFKTLKLPEDLAVYFENVEVTKVSKTSTNSLARVYIKSDRVIEKPIIFKVEDALKKQIFRISNMDVRIIDRYHLSKQYTPVTIMEVYYDSILFELEKYWTLEYNLLKNSSWEFEEEDRLVLELEDGFLARTYADSLADYFHKVFLNRFGFEIDVVYRYKTKNGSHYQKENEHKLVLLRRHLRFWKKSPVRKIRKKPQAKKRPHRQLQRRQALYRAKALADRKTEAFQEMINFIKNRPMMTFYTAGILMKNRCR